MATTEANGRLLRQSSPRLVNSVYLLYFSGFLDLFGVSITMPLILPYARDLGASPTLAGILGSVYGALQLFSSPILGQWSDEIGRHVSLAVCLAVSGVGYMMMGLASSIPLLLLSRIPVGIFKHSQSFSRTFLADLVPEGQRSSVLGHFNAASSIGFIVGPIVGGHVAERPGGFQMAAVLTGVIFCANAALIWFLTPSTNQAKDTTTTRLERDESSLSLKSLASGEISFRPSNLLQSFRAVDWADLWDLFLIKFLAGFSVILFRSNFNQTLKDKFAASPKTRGYMMSYSGTVAAVCGIGVGRFTKLYSSTSNVFLHMMILQAITLFSLTISPSVSFIYIFLTPLSFVTSTQRVVAVDLTMKRGCKQGRGGLMGLSHSVMSVARMLSPFLAGLAQEVHVDGAAVVAIVATLCGVVLVYCRPQDPEDRKRKTE